MINLKEFWTSKQEKHITHLQNNKIKRGKNIIKRPYARFSARMSFSCPIRADGMSWHYHPRLNYGPNDGNPFYIYNKSIRKAHSKERSNRRREELKIFIRTINIDSK